MPQQNQRQPLFKKQQTQPAQQQVQQQPVQPTQQYQQPVQQQPVQQQPQVKRGGGAKKVLLITGAVVLGIAVIAVAVFLLLGSGAQQEFTQKSTILIPFLFRNKK